MGEFTAYAQALAAELNKLDGVRTIPDVPETPNFVVHFTAEQIALLHAFEKQIEEDKVWLSGYTLPTSYEDVQAIEVAIGESSMKLQPADWAKHFQDVLQSARDQES